MSKKELDILRYGIHYEVHGERRFSMDREPRNSHAFKKISFSVNEYSLFRNKEYLLSIRGCIRIEKWRSRSTKAYILQT